MTLPFRRPRAGIRPSPVFLVVVALTVAGGYLAWQATAATRTARLGVFVFIVAGWVVTVCIHEFAHAFLAWRFGDREVEARGYLTLNPLKYSHPVLSILLPVLFIAIGGIGLPGGAVYLHPHRFRSNAQRALVSLSGPATNIVVAVLLLVLVRRVGLHSEHGVFWYGVAGLALLQVMASVLNLLPVPGLDGYGAIEPYLDRGFQRSAEQFKPFGMLALFALLQIRSVNEAFFRVIYWLFELSGLPSAVGQVGLELLRFWEST
ncbi:site-2 protease family protein [Jatrophihabitans sp.]|uniref:site-2 protease family protein n=1 Tax=Jatrophihabitans sp. TaxID=1932789 RepID=UPI002BE62902|nr:site-2 protease family protein [Jatrophihabitans sp.]